MASQQASSPSGPTVKKARMEADSWSLVKDEPNIKHDHVFSIANFSKKMEMTVGANFSSSDFNIQIKDKQTKWTLRCYPNGMKEEYQSSVGIYVYLQKDYDVQIKSEVQMSIVNKAGEREKVKSNSVKQTFDPYEVRMFGWHLFIRHEELRSDPNLLPDDVLTFHCALTILQEGKSVVTSGTNRPVPTPGSGGHVAEQASMVKCAEDLGAIFLNGKFSDFTVTCQGKEYKCHKNILAQRSSYFDAMLSHDMAESQNNEVELKDLESDTADDLLTYIYTGKVNGLGEKAADLLDVADKYGLPGLKEMSEAALCANMNIGNTLDMLVLADHYNASTLRSVGLKFVGENVKEIVKQEGWRKKLKNYPEIISDILEAAIHL